MEFGFFQCHFVNDTVATSKYCSVHLCLGIQFFLAILTKICSSSMDEDEIEREGVGGHTIDFTIFYRDLNLLALLD